MTKNYVSYRKDVLERLHDAAREELINQCYSLLHDDVIPVTPFDDVDVNKKYGTVMELRKNAKVTVAEDKSLKTTVYIHFGSDPVSQEYAIIQHENPKYKHDYPTDFKFLENPFEQNYETIVKGVEGAIR